MRVVYEFPFSDVAPIASSELESLPAPPIAAGTNRYRLELGRAERLFGAKRYTQARPVFETLRPLADGDDRELVALRLAECDYMLKRPRNTRDGVRPYVDKAARQGEALYFYAVAVRDLGDLAEYLRVVRRIVNEFPTQSWAEEALNNLARYYILADDDEKADETFRELYEKFPDRATMRNAPPGRSAGVPTGAAGMWTPSVRSTRRRRNFRARTIARPGCTGRPRRTKPCRTASRARDSPSSRPTT